VSSAGPQVSVDLASRAKGSPEKVAIAVRLRQETAMTLQWVAARLKMGTWTHVSNLLRAKGKKDKRTDCVKS
jgi:hypothetical protein